MNMKAGPHNRLPRATIARCGRRPVTVRGAGHGTHALIEPPAGIGRFRQASAGLQCAVIVNRD
jgi:hypothetical protein